MDQNPPPIAVEIVPAPRLTLHGPAADGTAMPRTDCNSPVLRDKPLALASYVFVSSATTLMYLETVGGAFRKAVAFTHFVVDRIHGPDGILRLYLPPKVPFGC